jgi:outer membrane protein assembly factor BamE (lipoprotein component of BamABCDE complex)
MNRETKLCIGLITCLAALIGCRSPGTGNPAPVASATVSDDKPSKPNVRKLRATLTGKAMNEVVEILGQPSQVFTLEHRETWDYRDAAHDPVTGRTVHSIQILFVNRRVNSVNFSY